MGEGTGAVNLDRLDDLTRLDKAVNLYYQATPARMRLKDVRVFRASGIYDLCPVEAAFAIDAIRRGDERAAVGWAISRQLRYGLTPIVDTGTVIHRQLQYYAGITGKVRKGQWRCPSCGCLTAVSVPMPVRAIQVDGLDHRYPGRCPRCRGRNLGMYPPWLYVEPRLVEDAEGVPEQLRITGSADGIWTVPAGDGGELVDVVVDYKTINHKGWAEQYGKLPQDKHVSQIQTYLNLACADYGVLLYYNKDDSKHKKFIVSRIASDWDALLRRVRWARDGKMEGKARFRVCGNIGHPRSRECFFQEVCWGKKAPANFLA